MPSSSPDLDWEESPPHLAFLRSFLEPRSARDPSVDVDWQQALGEEPNQAIRRLLRAGALEHDDLGPYLTRRFTAAQLRDALRARGLPVGGRKEELIARLLEADAEGLRETVADEVLLRCSDRGRQVIERLQEQEAQAVAMQEVALPEDEGASRAGSEPVSGHEEAESLEKPLQPDLNAKAKAAWAWIQALAIRLWLWLRQAVGALARKVRELELGARARAAWRWAGVSASHAWEYLQRTARSAAKRRGAALAQKGSERRLSGPSAPTSPETVGARLQEAGVEGCQPGAPPARDAVQADVTRAGTEREIVPVVAERRPSSVALEDRHDQPSATDWVARGERDLAVGEYRQAADDFCRAIDVDPQQTAAYSGRGSALAHLGEWEGAVADYERAIALEPQSAGMHHDLGVAYERKGDYQRALDSYRRAISLDPRLAGAYCGCGTAYRWLDDAPRALESYAKAIELDPRLAGAYSGTGDIYYVLGDYARAIAEYDRAIRLDLRYTEAYHNRGLAYEHLGDYRRAAADFRMVRDLAKDPDLREWVEERLQEVLAKLW